jgi:hypothetical protein
MQIRSLMFFVLTCLFAVPALAQDKRDRLAGKGANGEVIDFQPRRPCAGRPCCCSGRRGVRIARR